MPVIPRSWRVGSVLLWFSALLAAGVALGARPQRAADRSPSAVHLVLLGTTDLHGRIEPLDYWMNKPADLGLAKLGTLIEQVRARQANVLLLDSGDATEGTPLTYYFANKDTSLPNPMILAMNALHYDAMALGNHEFDYGVKALLKVKREAHFPILAANVRSACRECPNYLEPFVVKEIAGVRVAIVGFVTQVVPSWEPANNYQDYTFEPIVEAARRVIPEARRQADLVVAIVHSGLGGDPAAGIPDDPHDIKGENETIALAEQVPGIDVILFGHTHQEVASRTINGVLLAQAKNWGASLARADVDMQRDTQSRWRVAKKESTILRPTTETPPDAEIERLNEPYERATQAYLDKPVATSAKELDGIYGRYEDDPLVDLIHKVQLAYGHADVSLATIFVTSLKVAPGPVTVRELSGLYVYDNTLVTVQMTGAQLRQALEHAASFYSGWPVPAGKKMQLPDYYADSAEGVDYTLDLTRPAGDRIVGLRFHGAALDPAQKLRVAINSYRAVGGGKYDFSGLPIFSRSSQSILDLIIDYVTRTGTIPDAVDHNWHIAPQAAVDEMIRLTREADAQAAAPKSAAGFAPGRDFVTGVLQFRPELPSEHSAALRFPALL